MEIEGYREFEIVGSGGNAHVYRASAVETGEIVAIKVLRGGGDDSVLRRFERERSLMSELETIANVVPIRESGFAPSGDPYIVMPLYTGGSLQDRVAEGPMPWLEAVASVKVMAEAIALAHAKRILHLDLKPANVLLDENSDLWLSDFGIAEMMGSTVSMSAKMMTPAFTPPERLDGKKPSEQTDLYGLVATLFALLTGSAPYVTKETTGPMGVMMAIMREPVPVHLLPDSTPKSVRNLIRRGMAKDPVVRPKSAIELVGLLDDILEGRPVAAVPPVAATSAAAVAETASAEPDIAAGASTAATPESTTVDESATVVGMPLAAMAVTGNLAEAEEDESNRRAGLFAIASLLMIAAIGVAAFVLWPDGDSSETVSSDTVETAAEDVSGDAEELAQASGESAEQDGDAVADGDAQGGAEVADAIEGQDDDTGSEATETETTAPSEEGDSQVLDAEVSQDSDETTTTAPSTTSTTDRPTTTTTAAATTTTERPTTTTTERPTTTTTERSTTTTTEAPTTTSTSTTSTTTTSTTTTTTTTTQAPEPELEAGFIAAGGPTGNEQTVSFDNITQGDATSYEWDFGDGGRSTAFEPSHTYTSPGTYSVTITAFADGGSRDSATHSVRVSPNTVQQRQLEAGWTASASASPNQQTVNFRSITIGDADTFTWDFGDGSTGSGETISHTYAQPGRYSVTITASGAGGTDSATHEVRVDPNE